MDLSVVVASHANPQGLYLTVFSLFEQLSKTKLTWEIVIAADGGSEAKWEKIPNIRCLRIRTGSPQGTRDAGIRAAQAQAVLVVEDHVVVSDVKALYDAHIALNGAMTFPARFFEGSEFFNAYGTETDWDGNLWFKRTLYSPRAGQPYRVPQFGHSCFMISRATYRAMGGYTDLLTGYGGEESLLCLKFWMMGFQIWQVPTIWHAHFLSDHGMGAGMASENFKKNFQIVRFVLTGHQDGLQLTPDILAERKRIESGPFEGNITKLREYFRREGIA